jgi:hypothetical protein
MATMEDVVKLWDTRNKSNPDMQIIRNTGLSRAYPIDDRISEEKEHKRTDLLAKIRLSTKVPDDVTILNTRYLFKIENHVKSKDFEVKFKIMFENFLKSSPFAKNANNLRKFCSQLNNHPINGHPLKCQSSRTQLETARLTLEIPLTSTDKFACDCMEELINLTQKSLRNILNV